MTAENAISTQRNGWLKVINYRHLFFVSLILSQMLVYNYPYFLRTEPRNLHCFRQYDCLSFAHNFYNGRATFFEPCLNNLGTTGDGKTAAEFPIIQWTIGQVWKVTGVSIMLYRLVNLVFLFFGLFFIYRLFLLKFGSKIFSALISALVFTSPVLSYYGVSVLSDIQSFSLSMMGLYFFYCWIRNGSSKNLVIFSLTIALAGLLKASSAFVFLACMVFYLLLRRGSDRAAPKLSLRSLLLLVLPLIAWALWYTYANGYNSRHNNEFFLIGILPLWASGMETVRDTLTALVYNTGPSFFNPVLLCLILVATLVAVFFCLKSNRLAAIMMGVCLLLFLIFVLLFFQALDVHDYYFINMTGLLVVSVFFGFSIVYEGLKTYWRPMIFVLVLFVVSGTYTSGIKTWKKTNFNVLDIKDGFVFNTAEQKNLFWIHWLGRQEFSVLANGHIDLGKYGVMRTDTIMCVGDQTLNRALFLLDRVGYTDWNRPYEDVVDFVSNHREIGYLVFINPGQRKGKQLDTLLTNKIHEEENFSLYKIGR